MPGFQFEVNRAWIENPAIFYHVGVDGLSLWLVVLVGLLGPIGVVASWNAIKERRKVFYRALSGAADGHAGRLRLARSDALLRLLGAVAGAHGHPDRHVRAQGRTQGRAEVLPLHLHSLRAAAGGDSLALRADGQLRLRDAPNPDRPRELPCRADVLGRLRLPLRLCRQGSGLPAARMAGGHLQRSAGCPGHGCRRQAGPLLHAALPHRALPRAGAGAGALADWACCRRHSLRRVPGAGAARLLAADGLSPP